MCCRRPKIDRLSRFNRRQQTTNISAKDDELLLVLASLQPLLLLALSVWDWQSGFNTAHVCTKQIAAIGKLLLLKRVFGAQSFDAYAKCLE